MNFDPKRIQYAEARSAAKAANCMQLAHSRRTTVGRLPLVGLMLAAAIGKEAVAQHPPPPKVFYATISNASSGTAQCVIFGGNGTETYPSRYNWSSGPFCGFPGGLPALLVNRQAVWKFVPLVDDKYMITNASGPNGEQCLIFGGNGSEPNPQRYNWGTGPFCGFPGGKDALIANKQAVWRLAPLISGQYTITNDSGGGGERCLIFGGNGTDAYPQRYNWGSGPYCGFPGGQGPFLGNQQGAWTVQPLGYAGDDQ